MKRIFRLAVILIIVILAVLIYRTLSFNPVEYKALSEKVKAQAHPEHLARALQFQTISHKPGMIDSAAFSGLHEHIRSSFPLVDSLLDTEIVGDHSLMFYWQGSDSDLEPVIIMAHMDVVPVEYSSRNQWDHPPFDGLIAEGFIYGRGALDDKGSLFAILDAVEYLLGAGFTPQRSIYLCFGHDEEIGGKYGAEQIRDLLVERGVSAWMVLDEGGTLSTGLVPGISDTVALIGTGEKGYVSLELSADIPGGHSSMPEKENALGLVNRALISLDEHPLPYRFSPPLLGFIDHVGPHLPGMKKMAFANTWLLKSMIYKAYSQTAAGAALIQTTQVATVFNSGVKDNVVPYRAQALVNYRILPGDSPESLLARAKDVVNDDRVKIRIYQDLAISPSPLSPIDCDQFRHVAGAIRTVNQSALISPYLVLAATDGRHFYELSDHVYRFSPIPIDKSDLPRIHGVNERVSVKAYGEAVDFYATLMKAL